MEGELCVSTCDAKSGSTSSDSSGFHVAMVDCEVRLSKAIDEGIHGLENDEEMSKREEVRLRDVVATC